MNIFVLDLDPVKAAKYHCDKHVVKMILESVQMLMTAYDEQDELFYKPTHLNHPCTKWVRESYENWEWLYHMTCALHTEWRERYNHSEDKLHKAFERLALVINIYGFPNLPSKGLTPFAQAMPEEYKSDNVVESYRTYYRIEKEHFCEWRNGEPDWWQ